MGKALVTLDGESFGYWGSGCRDVRIKLNFWAAFDVGVMNDVKVDS